MGSILSTNIKSAQKARPDQETGIVNEIGYDGIEVTSRLMNIILEMPLDQQIDLLGRLDTNGYHGTRRFARTLLKNPWLVEVSQGNMKDSEDYYIKDIGRCGMFIKTDRAFDVGEKIIMQFQMPVSRKIFKIVGEIVRYEPTGIGVKFLRQLSRQ